MQVIETRILPGIKGPVELGFTAEDNDFFSFINATRGIRREDFTAEDLQAPGAPPTFENFPRIIRPVTVGHPEAQAIDRMRVAPSRSFLLMFILRRLRVAEKEHNIAIAQDVIFMTRKQFASHVKKYPDALWFGTPNL